SLEASKPEERRVAAVDFEGLQLLEKKKIEDDAKLKAENVRKAKEAAAKEAKPRKVSIQEYLKNEDGSAYVPPTPPRRPQYGGGYRGGRGNGSYNGRSSRDNSSERRVYNSGRGENAIVFHNVEANANDSGASRRGEGYNGERQQGGYQQGGYNGGRGNGRYQERQDGYNGERRDQQQGGYYQERRDAYNGDRREQGGYNNGGRGNGGNQEGQEGGERRQQGGYNNGGGYQQGGNYRQWQGPRPKQDKEFTPADFPALGGASQAQSQAQA
uniref:Hyaluronan/mRNA-binding protein domain-containing protein n=1 Tax=Aegilops tauschii subsp. strangulata TaxID=200361 RepID=A0A453MHG6_AEGTS